MGDAKISSFGRTGVLHHVIIRGIERRKIFLDGKIRHDLLDSLGMIVPESKMSCYGWALMSNHALC